MATKKKTTPLQKVSTNKTQALLFVVLVGVLGYYLVMKVLAAGGSGVASLPECKITPGLPHPGDYVTATVKMGAVPSDSRDGKYWVKNSTPYNTAYSDAVVVDEAAGTATYKFAAPTIKGKYAFYFNYLRKGDGNDYVENNDIVRVSQTCSVFVK